MLEFIIVFGAGLIIFGLFFLVLSTRKPSGKDQPAAGCCGGKNEKSHCSHCSEPIRMPLDNSLDKPSDKPFDKP